MQLSNRKKQIIQILIQEKDYTTAAQISEKLGVSRRTILRELASVEQWFSQQNIVLEKVTGKGMLVLADDLLRHSMLSNLESEKVDVSYSPFERQRKIVLELLNANAPLKIFYFSNMLKVSEATISYDLNKVETWLQSWQLKLIRKPGFGVFVEGRESNFRKAIIHMFNEYFDRGEMIQLIKDDYIDKSSLNKKSSVKKTLLEVVGYSLLDQIEQALKASHVFENYKLADNAYAALVIHLSLAIKRLSDGENIHFDPQKLEELRDTKEFEMGSKIAQAIELTFGISIPIDEIGYITMHIQGSRLRWTRNNLAEIKVQDYEVIYLIEKLIKEMESITGYILVENQQLVSGLINHFGPAIARIKQGVEIRNPLLNDMKERYKVYFDSVREAVEVVEQQLGIEIPDDEVAYLTMHFAAAVETIKKVAASYWRVAIVCSTGIGSSKLLEARIKKTYENMIVKAVLSSIELEEQSLEDVDLILSTIPVTVHKPLVVVSPLLLEENMRDIENTLNTLTPLREHEIENASHVNFVQKLNQLSAITSAALEILNNFFMLTAEAVTLDEFAELAARYICFDGNEEILIKELKQREEKGTTWFDNKNGRLLHCQSKVVHQLYFGFVISDCGDYAAVMVGHENLNVITRKLLGQISYNLMDHKEWLRSIKAQDLKKSYNILENIIQDYFQDILKGGQDE